MKTTFYLQCFREELLRTKFLTQVDSTRGWSDTRLFAVLLKHTRTLWPGLQCKLSYVWVSFKLISISVNSRLMTLAWGLGRLQMAAPQNAQITLLWAPQCQNYAATRMPASYCKAGLGIPLLYGCCFRVSRPPEKTTVEMDLPYSGNHTNYTFQHTVCQYSYSEQKNPVGHLYSTQLSSQPHSAGASPAFPCEKIKPVLA